jgi:4-aminobutyrate aminotransferase / (S)-3-amino-2-methylpropionate transaminase / 5-aminovalerate transaminase
MRALELVRSPDQREPAKQETEEVLRHCRERGLILLSAGSYGNVVRLLVPLVVTTEQFDEGLNVLESALAVVAESQVETAPRHA